MKLIKTAVAAALATLAFSASAMTQIADTELSTVSGQDGVSIAANLNINMDSFVYTDTDVGTGGSVNFNKIHIGGLIAASIDIINHSVFDTILTGAHVDLKTIGGAASTAFYNGTTDVVQIAVPNVSTVHALDMSVGGIVMGGNGSAVNANGTNMATGPSFGSFAMNNVDLRGTTVWIWAH